MKKIVTMTLALVCAAQILSAIPAKPGKFTRTLPNGRTITLQLHGDEFRHWMTDESGQIVKEDKNGNIVPSSMAEVKVHMGGADAVNRDRMRRIESTKRMMRKGAPTRSSDGSIHFPMILVQFPDKKFSVQTTDEKVWDAFNSLANEVGYSTFGGTGSIHDYYVDNTMGQTDFYFDVYGPVTVSRSYKYYGTEKQSVVDDYSVEPAAEALMEAIHIIAAEQGEAVFNPYDNDGDGYVDAVFMYYAGYNEAEGGPSETIWPHEWHVGAYDYFFDTHYSEEMFGNVCFGTYSCSSELKGGSGRRMCGIGTAVHEFGHALGLPDFYDTNYNKYGDGQCGALFNFSPMCGGSYNNDSRTPASFTIEERMLMGWADGIEPLPSSGDITIPALATHNFAYKEETANPGEYFVFECRNGEGWDKYVAQGMVVYHVDKSDNPVFIFDGPGTGYQTTAGEVWWNGWDINTNVEHPCYYAVPAVDQDNRAFGGDYEYVPFPGSGNVTTYQWQGWDSDNRQSGMFLGITYQGGQVTMHRENLGVGFLGTVLDGYGNPVDGVTVSVYSAYSPARLPLQSKSASAGGPVRIARRVGNPLRTVQCDEEGFYKMELEDLDLSGDVTLEVSAPGYLSKIRKISLKSKLVAKEDFRIQRVGESAGGTLKKYDEETGGAILGYGSEDPGIRMAAIKFTAEELVLFAGRKITRLDFCYYVGRYSSLAGAQGVIDFGNTRLLVKDATISEDGNAAYVDLSEEEIRIPENTECCFGYALLGCSEPYPYYYAPQGAVEGGLLLFEPNDPNNPNVPDTVEWWDFSYAEDYGPLIISVTLEDGTVLQYNYIANPSAGTYAVGETLDLNLVRVSNDHAPGTDISWYYDDEPVSGKVTFTRAGRHTLEARFTTVAGRRKVVELEITVE